MTKSIFELALIAIFTGILFAVEQVLAFIPNVQLTVFLLILYTRIFGGKKTFFIALLHTLMDNIYNGTLMMHMVIPMAIAWSLIPLMLSTIFKRFNSSVSLALFAFLFGFLYGMIFIPFSVFTYGYPLWAYYLSDLPFELMMGISGALSVAILYQPVYLILNKELSQYHLLEEKRYIND
ncbi:MAG: hypothetical protein RBQ91_06550 [Acholeplasma sp.]|nr:hypothetical protein [Acholeplasma sp.]